MRGSLSSTPPSGCGSTVVEVDGEKIDITEEMEELFRRDQSLVKEDIRKFIGERHISQSSIAKATRNGEDGQGRASGRSSGSSVWLRSELAH